MRESSSKLRKFGTFSGYLAPLVIGIMAALLELGGEGARQALRFDRDAIADLELWRLVSGHLVHLGVSHMLMNVVALAVLAYVLKPYLRDTDWVIAAVAGAAAIDLGLLAVHTGVQWYVGLSGVLHGFWAAACVFAIGRRKPEAIVLTLLLVAKIGYEIWIGPVALTGAIAAGPVVTEAHWWGALGGASGALVTAATRGAR